MTPEQAFFERYNYTPAKDSVLLVRFRNGWNDAIKAAAEYVHGMAFTYDSDDVSSSHAAESILEMQSKPQNAT